MNKLTPIFIAVALAVSAGLVIAQSRLGADGAMPDHAMPGHSMPASGNMATEASGP